MKVVVLGANSFSGQDFVDCLLDDPSYDLVGISRSAERTPLFLKYRTRDDLSRYRYHRLDMNRDAGDLLALVDRERPEAIMNFAAQSEVAQVGITPSIGFRRIQLRSAPREPPQSSRTSSRSFISSPEAYGTCVGRVTERAAQPSTPYAASKAAADFLLSTYARAIRFR